MKHACVFNSVYACKFVTPDSLWNVYVKILLKGSTN